MTVCILEALYCNGFDKYKSMHASSSALIALKCRFEIMMNIRKNIHCAELEVGVMGSSKLLFKPLPKLWLSSSSLAAAVYDVLQSAPNE